MDPIFWIFIAVFLALCTFRLWFPPLMFLGSVASGVVGVFLAGLITVLVVVGEVLLDEVRRFFRRRRMKKAKKR